MYTSTSTTIGATSVELQMAQEICGSKMNRLQQEKFLEWLESKMVLQDECLGLIE